MYRLEPRPDGSTPLQRGGSPARVSSRSFLSDANLADVPGAGRRSLPVRLAGVSAAPRVGRTCPRERPIRFGSRTSTRFTMADVVLDANVLVGSGTVSSSQIEHFRVEARESAGQRCARIFP